tara:strand:+ start:507 stop:1664 length:1158 start_codon:yes stop_codon:yes gene_type:complete
MGIKILGASTGSINLDVPASVSGNIDFTLPTNTGSADQLLVTDGSGNLSFKTVNSATTNFVINGEMLVDQRASGPYTTNGQYTLDRWRLEKNPSSVVAVTQDTDAPPGFSNSLKCETTSLGSPPSYEYGLLVTKLEGNATLPLGWTTTSPQPATLSFYAKASIAGTWCVTISDANNNNQFIATYTISSANTWERKSITIPNSFSSSNSFSTDNQISIQIKFDLGHGSMWQTDAPNHWITQSSYASTSGAVHLSYNLNATFKVTGVQLEVGDTVSKYQHESYAESLARCLRYFCKLKWSLCNPIYGIAYRIIAPAPVMKMRANPSVAYFSPSTGASNVTYEHSSASARTINSVNSTSDTAGPSTYFGMSTNAVYGQYVNTHFDAEL